ncbi:hypothetical protein F2Q69_00028782 [Brassica cretica]|uniref:Uncharacterized protein n=1 Tax=Brassica cretica TaxID=69181 RepID=A0A8S9RXT8_BRACR|nr:hypothetical protein F2Q69_00028782 [Brassica cretica]
MWTVWSLENDLVARRLHEDLGIIGDGGTKALLVRSRLGPGGPCQTTRDSLIRSRDRDWNPEVCVIGPGGRMRIQGFSLRSGGRIGPLVYLYPEAFEAVLEPEDLDSEIAGWNPEIGGSHKDSEFLGNPECFIFGRDRTPSPRQNYYRYLFGFRILPLGSWPLSSSYDVFYFGRKSLTGLEGAGVGCTGVLGSFDSILRLAHTHSCFMPHTRFDSLWVCHCGHASFVRLARIGGLWRPDPARMPL